VLGYEAPAPAKVMYVDGEMHVAEVVERLRSLLKSETIDRLDAKAAGRNLHVYSRQHQNLNVDFWDLLDPVDQDVLVRKLIKERYELVVFDNFTTLSDSLGDENSAGSMKPALNMMLKLKQSGIATILVHHANKLGKSYRGSTAIAATFEVILALQEVKAPDKERRNSAGFLLHTEKFRGRRDDTMADRRMFLVNDRWEVDGEEEQRANRVVDAIRSQQYVNQTEVADAIGIHTGTTSREIKRAIILGLITETERDECFARAVKLRELAAVDVVDETP
jgi:hypothetical protein